MKKEDIVRNYFQAWLDKNCEVIDQVFDDHIVYSECYGPEYHGISQVRTWFTDWNHLGTVLEWRIKKFIHQDNVTVVEWYFKCNYKNEISGFDGVSMIEFNDNMKIISLKEFQSKAEHSFPYES